MNQSPDADRSRAARRSGAEHIAVALAGLRQPVVVILLLISFFSAISGKPLDGALLLLAGTCLAVDAAKAGPAAMAPAQRQAAPARPAPAARRVALVVVGLGAIVGYAAVVGSFARFSWPPTVAVAAVGVAVVAIGWRGPRGHRHAAPQPRRPGAVLWGVIAVVGGLWELGAFALQPDITSDSYAHPTISTLTDPLLASHGGRSLVLGIWLVAGWLLVER